jgi:hypothetical protein
MYENFPYLRPLALLLRDGESEGGSGGGGGFYRAQEGAGGGSEGGEGDQSAEGGESGQSAGEQPEWLMEKYLVKGEDDAIDLSASAQKQAEAYRELYGRFSKKTDDLRAEVKDEAIKEYGKTIGVPEDVSEYEYPENIEAPAEELDEGLRNWAQKHNVSKEGFQELIQDVYGQTLPNYEAEYEALGDNADERIDHVNKWLHKNVESEFEPQVKSLLTTAKGVEFVESMMKKAGSNGFAPDTDGESGNTPMTRDEIREMQADPRFGSDDAYTKKVRKAWSDFARRGGK